ncbi:TPA: hypothetical protein DCX15_03980 [bacterium]|nr:hypothetical protein [bacterium]
MQKSLLLLSIVLLFANLSFAAEPDRLYEQANTAFAARNYKEAKGLFEKYLILFPDGKDRTKVQYFLGESSYQLNQFQNAIDAFNVVVRCYPDDPLAIDAQNRIGDSYQRLGRTGEALKAYQKVAEKHPHTQQAEYANYSISWLKNPDLKLKPKIHLLPDVQMQLAKEAFARKEYEKAKVEFENFLHSFPDHEMAPYARIQVAECHYHLGRYAEAIPNYQKALTNYPENLYRDYAQYSIGWCYYRLGNLKEALEAFKRLAREFPKSRYLASLEGLSDEIKGKIQLKEAEELYNEAQDNYKRGNLALAYQELERLINEYPQSPYVPEAKIKLAEIKSALHPEAEKLYKEASKLHQGRDYEGAIEKYRWIISGYPSSEYAKLASKALALIVEEMIESEAAILWSKAEKAVDEGRREEAGNRYQEIIERYPTSSFGKKARERFNEILLIFEEKEAEKMYQLALGHLREERFQQAIGEFEKIILTYPKSRYIEPAKKGIVEARRALFELQAKRGYEIANEYYRLKDYNRALDEFQKVLEGYPGTPYAGKAKAAIDQISKIFLDKESEDVYNLARRYYSEGQLDKSFKEFQRLIDEYPESQYREAAVEAMAKISKEMVNEVAKELYDRGRGYQKNGDYALAIEEYEILLKRHPSSYWAPYAQYARTECFYTGYSDYRRAQAEWLKMVDTFPTHELSPHALYHVGECYEKLKEWEKAKATYKRLVEEYPESMYGKGELAQFIRAFLTSSQEGMKD